MKQRFITLIILLMGSCVGALAQSVGVKTNIPYLGTATPNLGIEVKMADKWTVDVSGGYNPFVMNKETGMKWKHWMVAPEVRYYTCEAFNGHFFGVHGLAGFFNVANIDLPIDKLKGLKDYRYQGWVYGGGVTYGYEFVLGKHWNLEASLSGGYLFFDYAKYNCEKCGKEIEKNTKHYFGPTKATISLIYLF